MRIFLMITHDPELRQYRNRELVDRLRARDVRSLVLSPGQIVVSLRSGRLTALGPAGFPIEDALILNALQRSNPADLDLIRILETAGHPIVNQADAWYIASVKALTGARLAAAGLPYPPTLFSPGVSAVLETEAAGLRGWVVTKPWSRAQQEQVRRYRSRQAAPTYRRRRRRGQPALLQEFVPNPGRSLRTIVVGQEVIGACHAVARKPEWKTKSGANARTVRCEVTPALQDLALAATRVVGLDIAAVELIEGPDGLELLGLSAWPDYERYDRVVGADVAGRIADFLLSRHLLVGHSAQIVASSRANRSVSASSRGPSGSAVGQ
jgi:RimK family alpha-L-glutamate ligase